MLFGFNKAVMALDHLLLCLAIAAEPLLEFARFPDSVLELDCLLLRDFSSGEVLSFAEERKACDLC